MASQFLEKKTEARFRFVLIIICFLLLFKTPGSISGNQKTYWHFTFKAFVDPHNSAAVEWAWVTMVEFSKEQIYSNSAATVRRMGGQLRGTIFAFVRGAAWRSRHSYSMRKRCKGRPAEMEIYWEESWSDKVFAGGQINNPYQRNEPGTGSRYLVENEFQFGFTTRPILRENGSWFDPKSRASVFVGPVRSGTSPAEEIRDNFVLYGVNYIDPLKHYRKCGKAWVKQYRSAFYHFQHNLLREQMGPGENDIFGQFGFGPRDEKIMVYSVIRSSSRTHPHWKKKEM